jgi:methylated-DNA-[protein]-cysteine S-methyltransferase
MTEQALPPTDSAHPVEPLRVLVDSPLGLLGVELLGAMVIGLRFSPPARERRLYQPLAKIRRNETVDEIVGRLSEYLAGVRRSPEIEFDLEPVVPDSFNRRVLKEVCKIPCGRTRTYQYIADASGRADSYRQVLSILQANPIAILVPCHRVVAKTGLGSYIGGVKRKQWLLKLEAHATAPIP